MKGGVGQAARRVVSGAAALSLLLTPLPAIAQATAVGVNAAVRNQVQIGRGGARPRPAVVRERVLLADEVRTGPASQLQILLLDRSTFTVGANARVRIDRFVYDPARNSRDMGASVTRGAFRFMSGRNAARPGGQARIETPVASIGIRGTIVEGVVGEDAVRIASGEPAVGLGVGGDSDAATLIVLRGPGPASRGDVRPGAVDVHAGGRTLLLDRPSLALYLPGRGMAPIGPFPISTGGLRALQDLLRTTPAALPTFADRPGPPPAAEPRAAEPRAATDTPAPQPPPGAPPPPAGPGRAADARAGGGWTVTYLLLPAVIVVALLVAVFASDDERPRSP